MYMVMKSKKMCSIASVGDYSEEHNADICRWTLGDRLYEEIVELKKERKK